MNKTVKLAMLFVVLAIMFVAASSTTFDRGPSKVQANSAENPECSLVMSRSGQAVTVEKGPCYRSDFPLWCNDYVPSVIVQGQTVRCEMRQSVVPTARPRPTRKSTPTPMPLIDRLRRPFNSFR